MISWRRLRAIMYKELIELLRDRRTMFVMLVMPVIQLILFTSAIESDLNRLPIGWLDLNRTEMTRELRSAITVDDHFKVIDYDSQFFAERALLRGNIKAIVVIKPDLSRSIVRGDIARVQLLIDGSDPNLARSITGYFQAIYNNFYIDRMTQLMPSAAQISPPLDIRMRMLYNEDLSSVRFMVPGLLVYIIAFLTLVITALTMVKELESGTIEQLFVTPVTRHEVILGKLLPFGFVAMIIGTTVALAGWLIFGVGVRGSMIALIVIGAIFALTTLATGLFFSVISRTTLQAVQAAMSVTIPSMLISGFMFPIFTMPKIYIILSNFLPMTFALKGVRGIYLQGLTFSQCLPYIGILFVFLVLQLFVTIRLFNRRIG